MSFSLPKVRSLALRLTTASIIPLLVMGALNPRNAVAVPRQDAARAAEPADKTYPLLRVYKIGETNHYKVEIRTTFNGADVYFNTVMNETAKEVKPDGMTTLNYDADTAYLKAGDTEMDASESMPKVTEVLDKQGKLTDSKVEEGAGSLGQVFGGVFPMAISVWHLFYPTTAVKSGEEWKIDYTRDHGKDGKVVATGTAKITGTEKVGDLDTVKVKVVADFKAVGATTGQQHFDFVGNIEPESGRFVRMVGTSEGILGTGPKTKLNINTILMKGDSPIDAPAKGAPKKESTAKSDK